MFYRGGSNLRRMYEDADLPDRLVVVGDSLCSFNPARSSPTRSFALFPDTCQKGRVSLETACDLSRGISQPHVSVMLFHSSSLLCSFPQVRYSRTRSLFSTQEVATNVHKRQTGTMGYEPFVECCLGGMMSV